MNISRYAAAPFAEANSSEADFDLLPVLQALADSSRLRIIRMLREREQCVCHLTESLGLSQGTISHHVGVLKRVGLVLDRRDETDARWVYYRLAPLAERVGRELAELLDATRVDPIPAVCADSTKEGRRPKSTMGGLETVAPSESRITDGGK